MPVWGTSISQPWGVSSFGQSDIHSEPDYAVLQVAINRLHNKPKNALEAAKANAGAVRAVVRRRGVPDDGVTSSRTSVQSAWDGYGPGRKFLGHQCRIEFAVRIANLDLVDQILIDVVDAGADEIISLKYDTSAKRERRRPSRVFASALSAAGRAAA